MRRGGLPNEGKERLAVGHISLRDETPGKFTVVQRLTTIGQNELLAISSIGEEPTRLSPVGRFLVRGPTAVIDQTRNHDG